MILVRRLLRYGTVSLVSTTVSLTLLGALVATRALTPGWANLAATAAGTIPSFELNRRWVWRRSGRRSLVAEVVPFCVLSLAGLALSTVAVAATADWAARAGAGGLARTLAVEAANVSAFGTLWVAQFVLLDRVLFARPRLAPAMVALARDPDDAALCRTGAERARAA